MHAGLVRLAAAKRTVGAASAGAVRYRSLATAAAAHGEVAAAGGVAARKPAPVNLSNVEAEWAGLSEAEKAAVHEQLEVVQQKDWKELTLAEKKAGECFFRCWNRVGGRREQRRRVRGRGEGSGRVVSTRGWPRPDHCPLRVVNRH